MPIKFFILVFVIFAIGRVGSRFRRSEIGAGEFFGWLVVWLSLAVATLWHKTTDSLAQLFGVSRGADLLVYLSVVVLFFLIFRIAVKLERTDRQITKLVRQLALENSETDRSDRSNEKPDAGSIRDHA